MAALSISTLIEFCCGFQWCLLAAASSGMAAAGLKAYQNYLDTEFLEGNLFDSQAYSAFSFLLALILAFRNGQAYSRFWEGATMVHEMCGDWYDAASSLIAFTEYSDADEEPVAEFINVIVRLFSLQNALILAELEAPGESSKRAHTYDLLDVRGIDATSLKTISTVGCKPEFVFQKLQQLVVHNLKTGVLNIPPPIVTRAFQEMGSGMLKYHQLLKLTKVPFPLPYRVATELLLVLHMLISPIMMSVMTETSAWAALFTGTAVFILTTLGSLANRLDNPFAAWTTDLNCEEIQHDVNLRLAELLANSHKPHVMLSIQSERNTTKLLAGIKDSVLGRSGSKSLSFSQAARPRRTSVWRASVWANIGTPEWLDENDIHDLTPPLCISGSNTSSLPLRSSLASSVGLDPTQLTETTTALPKSAPSLRPAPPMLPSISSNALSGGQRHAVACHVCLERVESGHHGSSESVELRAEETMDNAKTVVTHACKRDNLFTEQKQAVVAYGDDHLRDVAVAPFAPARASTDCDDIAPPPALQPWPIREDVRLPENVGAWY